jgi:hypothetical protein
MEEDSEHKMESNRLSQEKFSAMAIDKIIS